MRGSPRRAISIFGQRSITTFSPAASARAAASSFTTPICIHTALAPTKIAWSTACPAASNEPESEIFAALAAQLLAALAH